MPEPSLTVNRGRITVDDMNTGNKRWVVAAEKGGGGKTTLAASFAGALAEGSTRGRRGPARRVLVIDLDPQGAVSAALGAVPSGSSVYNVLMGGTDPASTIVPSQPPVSTCCLPWRTWPAPRWNCLAARTGRRASATFLTRWTLTTTS